MLTGSIKRPARQNFKRTQKVLHNHKRWEFCSVLCLLSQETISLRVNSAIFWKLICAQYVRKSSYLYAKNLCNVCGINKEWFFCPLRNFLVLFNSSSFIYISRKSFVFLLCSLVNFAVLPQSLPSLKLFYSSQLKCEFQES